MCVITYTSLYFAYFSGVCRNLHGISYLIVIYVVMVFTCFNSFLVCFTTYTSLYFRVCFSLHGLVHSLN